MSVKTAPVLAALSIGVFALMIAFFGATEAATLPLFPVGVAMLWLFGVIGNAWG